jgi:hypothetical protein
MADGIRWIGLDVHVHESTFAIFDQGTGEVMTKRVVGRPRELLAWLRGVGRPVRAVYEAGPTGYGLARRARAEGIEVVVCAPGRTDRAPSDRVKTDKRDAVRLARRLAAGELTIVTVPSVEHEQLRDLVPTRDGPRRSRGCGACGGSTPSQLSGCALRSASLVALSTPTACPRISGSFRRGTAPASAAAKARSRKPAPRTPDGC